MEYIGTYKGQTVTFRYRINGNWDIVRNGEWTGEVYFGTLPADATRVQ